MKLTNNPNEELTYLVTKQPSLNKQIMKEELLSQDDFLPGNLGADTINNLFNAFQKLNGKVSGLETRIKVLEISSMTPKALNRGSYKGKSVEEMTKEELIDALVVMNNLYQQVLLNELTKENR